MKDLDYEEGATALVKEHKSNLVKLLREGVDGTDEEIMERAFVIEENARALTELTDHYDDGDAIYMQYSDGLNHWEIKHQSAKDQFGAWCDERGLSAREYFGILKLAVGDATLCTVDLMDRLNEDTFQKVMYVLKGAKNA